MVHFFSYDGNILIPMQLINIKFCKKEDRSLNAFQNFILESVESHSSINQIAQASLLTENVINTEIIQMLSQKLLVKNGDAIELSNVSRIILMVDQYIKKLNDSKITAYINLMTGELDGDSANVSKYDELSDIVLKPTLSKRDISGISIEENMDFFRSYLNESGGMSEEEITSFLTSVYVELKAVGTEKNCCVCPISKLPCLIGIPSEIVSSIPVEDVLTAKGKWYKIKYTVRSEAIEPYKNIIPELEKIFSTYEPMLSDKAVGILSKYNEMQNYNNAGIWCYYDAISGTVDFNIPDVEENKQYRNNVINLPVNNDLTDHIRNEIMEATREFYDIPDEFILQESECTDNEYTVRCSLNELRGDING